VEGDLVDGYWFRLELDLWRALVWFDAWLFLQQLYRRMVFATSGLVSVEFGLLMELVQSVLVRLGMRFTLALNGWPQLLFSVVPWFVVFPFLSLSRRCLDMWDWLRSRSH